MFLVSLSKHKLLGSITQPNHRENSASDDVWMSQPVVVEWYFSFFKKEFNYSLGNDDIGYKNILILSTWRSGSTFTGDLLAHYPSTYYSYEPLYLLHKKVR